MSAPVVPERFRPAVAALAALVDEPHYRGALVFGSVAQGEATEQSDLDAVVIVSESSCSCANVSHPRLGGVKLDLSFLSLEALERRTEAELADGRRRAMIAGAWVLFDRTGRLDELVVEAGRPAAVYDWGRAQFDLFMLHHANEKVERFLTGDPASALYSMHATINDVLEIHSRVHQRHKVSSKRALADLDSWDPALADLVRRFVALGEAPAKFAVWSEIVDHVAAGLGGRRPIEDNLCPCPVCQAGLAALQR